jgi:hypothetical protein
VVAVAVLRASGGGTPKQAARQAKGQGDEQACSGRGGGP